MNLNKFNYYKNAKYSYIASGILLVAGLIIGLIFGLNTDLFIDSSSYLNCVLAVLIFCIIAFTYITIRYEVYMAFTMVLAIVHNVSLLVALVALFRIPVTDNFIMSLIIICALTLINNLLMFNDVKEEHRKPESREVMVNGLINKRFKLLSVINLVALVSVLLMFFSFDANIMNLIRPLLLGIVIIYYSSICMVMPFWGYFVKEKKKKKEQIEPSEQNYVK